MMLWQTEHYQQKSSPCILPIIYTRQSSNQEDHSNTFGANHLYYSECPDSTRIKELPQFKRTLLKLVQLGEQLGNSFTLSMQNQREHLIQQLQLSPHIEGGFFRQTYCSPLIHNNRHAMTVIHYMVTKESPLTAWHMNKSDVVHFHHRGGALRYFVLYPQDGRLEQHLLSNNIKQGTFQLTVPRNTWKACILENGDFGLISQAVAPGFDYEDMTMIEASVLAEKFPQHRKFIEKIQVKRQKKE